jgi:hypothetical protein
MKHGAVIHEGVLMRMSSGAYPSDDLSIATVASGYLMNHPYPLNKRLHS